MNDHIFNKLCQTYGMAPTKPLRDLVETAVKQEREACIKACDTVDFRGADECIAAIKARNNT